MKNFSASHIFAVLSLIGLAMLFQNCGTRFTSPDGTDPQSNSGPPAQSSTCSAAELSQLETDMSTILAGATPAEGADENFTMTIQSSDNRSFTFSRNQINDANPAGQMSPSAQIDSASTAKMVTASVIMDLVSNPSLQIDLKGKPPLQLDSYVKDYLPAAAWLTLNELSPSSSHRINSMTLRHLLSFTSGLENEDACIGSGSARTSVNYDACVHSILAANITSSASNVNTRTFFYNGAHLAVAARLATYVTGKTWFDVFEDFKNRYGVFKTPTTDSALGAYYPRSEANRVPNPAGSLHYIVADYTAFMRKFYYGEVGRLSSTLPFTMRDEMMTNQLTAAKQQLPLTNGMFTGAPFDTVTPVTYSPARDDIVAGKIVQVGEDWRYGLGVWVECTASTFSSACLNGTFSAAGSFGAYGMMDMNVINGTSNVLTGFMGRQGASGSFNPNLYRMIKDKAHLWAAKSCP